MKRRQKRRSTSEYSPLRITVLLLFIAVVIGGLVFGGMQLRETILERKAAEEEAARIAAEAEAARREREQYPLGYLELVQTAAQTYDLPIHLILSVIRTESSFRPEAVSGAGAIGLMQIMPETFSWLCEKRGETHAEEELTDPAVNIDYGAYYLRVLLDYYNGSLDNALLAYNAGIGRVNSWLAEKELPRDGEIEEIPIAETASYLTKVHHAMDEYTRIYKGEYLP